MSSLREIIEMVDRLSRIVDLSIEFNLITDLQFEEGNG
jgi:hypothetical protein